MSEFLLENKEDGVNYCNKRDILLKGLDIKVSDKLYHLLSFQII